MPARGYIEQKQALEVVVTTDTQVGKLAGLPPVEGYRAWLWESGIASSGQPGGDLVTIGETGKKYKIHSLIVNIRELQLGGTINVRLYTVVGGVESKCYHQTFTQGADPDSLWIINGTVGIHNPLRVEVQTNRAFDNNNPIYYDYMLEAM
jgi:hypothetical protein